MIRFELNHEGYYFYSCFPRQVDKYTYKKNIDAKHQRRGESVHGSRGEDEHEGTAGRRPKRIQIQGRQLLIYIEIKKEFI